MSNFKIKKAIIAVILIVIALVSLLIVAPIASTPETYETSIEYLDGKREKALEMTAIARSVSVGISLIPGDVGNSVSDSLAKLSDSFLIVFCAIFLEKYLLTMTGCLTFKVLLPIALVLFAIYEIYPNLTIRSVANKMLALGIAIFLVVPIGIKISIMIEETYDTYEQVSVDVIEEDTTEITKEEEEEEGGGFFNTLKNDLLDLVDTVDTKVTNALERASDKANLLIEAFAVMIVTTCLIPILVFLFLIWVVKLILGIEIRMDFASRKLKSHFSRDTSSHIDE